MPYATSLCPPGSLSAWVSPTSGPGQAWPAALLDKDGQADAQDRTLSSLARGTATLIVHARFSANAKFLEEHGCDQVQGFLISRPVEAAAAERLLENPVLLDPRPEHR